MLSIDRISNISVEDFYQNYLLPNKPCIFTKNFTQHWKSITNWKGNNSTINLENVFRYNDQSDSVTVADCNRYYFDSHEKSDISIEEFRIYWTNFHNSIDQRSLYLKDWHYFLDNSEAEDCFELLEHFRRDWLNEFADARTDIRDDYRFVYFGPSGTWTGLHADVLRSHSWSANIVGRKHWTMFPPETEQSLQSVGTEADITEDGIPRIEVEQCEGEIIFVPSGWWHRVRNLTDCVSINHNWITGSSVGASWMHLCEQLNQVENETSDVKHTPGYHEQLQVCLKAYSGMNFEEFITMVELIIYKRLIKIIDLNAVKFDGRLSNVDCGDISKMRLFFEQTFFQQFKQIHLKIDWKDTIIDSRLDVMDICFGKRVLKTISTDIRCERLGLVSEQMQDLIQLLDSLISDDPLSL